jgi:hypothetical protein
MSSVIRANGPAAYSDIQLTAYPTLITAGGIVLLTADLPDRDGTYTVRWEVEGPVVLAEPEARIALLGATTVAGDEVDPSQVRLRATLDTTPLAVGSWRVRVVLAPVLGEQTGDDAGEAGELHGEADIEVRARPFAAGDDVSVSLRRTAVPPTPDQALWVAIRRSTNAIGFDNYSRFLEVVICGEPGPAGPRGTRQELRKANRRIGLPFPNVNRYRLLKAATEVFLMVHCGVDLDDFRQVDLAQESRRLNRTIRPGDLEAEMRDYLDRVATGEGDGLEVLPYLGLIRRQLGDVAIVGVDDDRESTEICFGIIAEKLTNPCFLELLWSYWLDESGLVHAMNAISWRFQNRSAGGPGRDPLATLDIDPLRPLNNLFWGYVQDRPHLLTTMRRSVEYDHLYGLTLARPGPPVRGADSRSRFLEAFHTLLAVTSQFYLRDDDTTVIADGFGVLNALKETHLLLSEGAHNQYGDLPWTARHEMLMYQWMFSRTELRDVLATRTMVAYPEPWMGPVEAMNRLQGWSDVSVLHFRDLAVFGEQLLLGIRFGAWTDVNEPEQAANWARYWRSELQRYVHAYRAVTGVDLTQRPDRSMPAFHLRRRHGAYRG